MRQIPKYGIIGSGKVAKHFTNYFTLLNINFNNWSRSKNNLDELESFANNTDIILLLIKDDIIESFINTHLVIQNKTIIHCSGCLSIDNTVGMHPLISFSDNLYDLKTYRKIVFIIDDKNFDFHKSFPMLDNHSYFIDKDLKSYYHALCVISGNFSVILWAKLFDELENRFNINKEAAYPYLESICSNLVSNHNKALTGPLVRNDIYTIQKNLSALKEDSFLSIYEAFLKLFQKEKI